MITMTILVHDISYFFTIGNLLVYKVVPVTSMNGWAVLRHGTYRESKWGIADNWGPYRAALS